MRADRTKIWDSVGLQKRFTELVVSCMKRGDLLRLLSLNADDLFILSAPGYRKVAMFHDNARATLKVTKYDDEEDNIMVLLATHVVVPTSSCPCKTHTRVFRGFS